MKKIYSQLNKKAFWCCLISSIALLVTSFIIPPLGVISPSVLEAVAELFAFGTLGTVITAIDRGSDITLKKGNTEVTIDNNEASE